MWVWEKQKRSDANVNDLHLALMSIIKLFKHNSAMKTLIQTSGLKVVTQQNMRDDDSQINLWSTDVPVRSAMAGAASKCKWFREEKKLDFIVKIKLTVFYRYPPRGSLIYQLPQQLLCYSQEPPVCLCCRYRSRRHEIWPVWDVGPQHPG